MPAKAELTEAAGVMQNNDTSDNLISALIYLVVFILLLTGAVLLTAKQAELNEQRTQQRLKLLRAAETHEKRETLNRIVLERNASQTRAHELPVWTLEEFLIMQAKHYGVDPVLAQAIIENEGDIGLKGRMVLNAEGASSALGPWQIIDSTWEEAVKQMGLVNADRNNYATNIEVGLFILKTQGTAPWASSKAGWGWAE